MAVSAPHATLSPAAIVAESARKYPDKVAVVDGDTRLTYRDLWDRARRVADACTSRVCGRVTGLR
ncbi:AMP-binding protein [Rhodococcus koreensis]